LFGDPSPNREAFMAENIKIVGDIRGNDSDRFESVPMDPGAARAFIAQNDFRWAIAVPVEAPANFVRREVYSRVPDSVMSRRSRDFRSDDRAYREAVGGVQRDIASGAFLTIEIERAKNPPAKDSRIVGVRPDGSAYESTEIDRESAQSTLGLLLRNGFVASADIVAVRTPVLDASVARGPETAGREPSTAVADQRNVSIMLARADQPLSARARAHPIYFLGDAVFILGDGKSATRVPELADDSKDASMTPHESSRAFEDRLRERIEQREPKTLHALNAVSIAGLEYGGVTIVHSPSKGRAADAEVVGGIIAAALRNQGHAVDVLVDRAATKTRAPEMAAVIER
jgi:hypothetical protein